MEYLAWLEVHATKMPGFLQDSEFFISPLRDELEINAPFRSLRDCLNGYNKTGAFSRKKSTSWEQRQALASCYALAITKFLIERKKFLWKLCTGCGASVYYEPLLLTKNNRYIDPIGVSMTYLAGYRKSSFELFYWFLTNTPFDELSRELLKEQSKS